MITVQGTPDGATAEKGRVVEAGLFLKVQKALLENDRQYIIRRFRFDPDQAIARLEEVAFSPSGEMKVANYAALLESMHTKLHETQAETAFPYLLRYGINKQIINLYELEKPTYQEWALTTTSTGFENYYPAVFLPSRPVRVERGQEYPEAQLSGFQVIIRNYKFAMMLAIEKELWEDDQSGQIPMRASGVGEGMGQTEEIFFYQQLLASVDAGTFTAVGTQNVGGGALLLGMLEKAHPIIRKIQDGDGNLIGVRPDALIVDALDELVADQLMTSVVAPQNPAGPSVTTTDANVIYFGTPNPMKGKYTVICTPFFTQARATPANPNGWGLDNATAPKLLAQKRKGVIFQNRTALKVVQETPNSGANFTRGDIRYAAERRFGAGVGEPRFEYILN